MEEKQNLLIYGAGDVGGRFAAEYRDLGKNKEKFNLIGFIDDAPNKKEVCGFPVVGKSEDLPKFLDKGIDNIVISLLLEPKKRLDICMKLDEMGFKFPSIIDAYLPKEAKIGKGVYIHESAVFIGYNFEIGDFSVISAGVQAGVDIQKIDGREVIVKKTTAIERSKIGKGVLISPGVCIGYNSEIGDATVMYINSMCAPNTKIGKGCYINMGAIAHGNVPDGKIVKTYNWIRNNRESF